MSKKVESTNVQVDNETNGVIIKSTNQVQLFEIEYKYKLYIFDIGVVKDPIKKDEELRSLRNYKVETSEEYIDIPISDFQGIQTTCDFYISSLFQLPKRSIEIKSKIIENLSCILFFQDGKWKTQFKYQDRYIPHPLPIASSKVVIYDNDNSRDNKLIEYLLNDELIKDTVKNKNNAKQIIQSIQSSAILMSGAINNLKVGLESIPEIEISKKEKLIELKNKIEQFYGDVVFKKAMELINDGQAQKFIIQEHQSTYGGISDRISWAISCIFASTNILSSNTGEHLKLSGSSGKGKTTIVTNYLDLVPTYLWIMTSPSGKNLYYNTRLHAGMVIIIDEFTNEEGELVKTIKLITSKFQDETTLDTIIKFESSTKTVPPRVAFILMSVLPLESTELLGRCITIDVPNDDIYLKGINIKQKEREGKLPTKNRQPNFNTQVCRCIHSILNMDVYDIRIPFSNVIEWKDVNHTRNWDLFADLIKCSAYYNILNRDFFNKPGDEEVGVYFATYKDYLNAMEVYNKLADNNATKLSNNELKIINTLKEARKKEISSQGARDTEKAKENIKQDSCINIDVEDVTTFGEMDVTNLSHASGLTATTIRNLIHGIKNNGGLLEKVFGIYYKMITIQTPYKNKTRSTRKEIMWYDGPDIIVVNIPIVPRDICDAETEIFKQNWLIQWENEDEKWNLLSEMV